MTVTHAIDPHSTIRLALAFAAAGWFLVSYARLLFGGRPREKRP